MRTVLTLFLSLFLSAPVWAASSRNFDGATNDRVDYGDVTDFDGSSELSISFWIYPDSVATGKRIITKWGDVRSTEEAFIVQINSTDEILMAVTDGDVAGLCHYTSSGLNLPTGTWTHILATWKYSGGLCPSTPAGSQEMKFYKNGVLQTATRTQSGTVDGGILNSSTSVQVGHETDEAADGVEGNYGWFGLWPLELTQADATTLASGVPPWLVETQSIKMCPVIFGSTVEDDPCSTYTGTITGTTVTALGPPVYASSGVAMMIRTWEKFWNQLTNWWIPEVWAADVALCNPSDPIVPNKLSFFQESIDGEPYRNNPDALVWFAPNDSMDQAELDRVNSLQSNFDATIRGGIATSDLKCQSGSLVELSQAEKDAIIADALAQSEAFLRSGTKAQFDGNSETPLALRCLASVILDEINTLRTRTNDIEGCISNASNLGQAKSCTDGLVDFSDRTLSQAKSAIASCVDNKTADE